MLPLGGHQLKKQTKSVNTAVIECNFEMLLIKLIKRSEISTHVLISIDNSKSTTKIFIKSHEY